VRADNLFRGGREQIGGLFFKRRAFDRCGFRSLSEQISSLFVVRFRVLAARSPHLDHGARKRRGVIADRAADASSYVLGRLLRTREKYIMAKAASSTPATIKIEVVTIAQFSSAGPYSLRPRKLPVVVPVL